MNASERINRFAVVVPNEFQESEDTVDFVKFRPKKPGRIQKDSRISGINKKFRQSVGNAIETLDNGILGFITIRVILWDILISVADIVSDFVQGFSLFRNPETRNYGIVSLSINWIPGLAAAIHLISMHRRTIPWTKLFPYALLLLIFYPIIPIFAFLRLLYKKPKSKYEPVTEEFTEVIFFIVAYRRCW